MGRGRKPISNFNGSDWETVFYNSVGTYVQYINIQLSKEYNLEPLSNHLKIVGGYAFKTAEYKSEGVPIIRISDFNNEQIVLKDVVFYQEAKELDKYKLIEGDIIIALTGGTIAKLAIVQAGLGKIYLNQRVGKFQVLNSDEFEVEYIYWLARSIQNIIKNLAWGAAIPNVSPKQIEELKFPFPSKKIQRGIIDFLNDLKNNNLQNEKIYFDEIIENEIIALQKKQITTSSISTELTHQLSLVKKLRQQLLQDAVQGKLVEQNKKDEPASELLKKIKAEKEKLISEKKLKKEKELSPINSEEIPFEIPDNWVWCRLGEVINFISGNNFNSTDFKKGNGTKCIKITNAGVGQIVETDDVLPLDFKEKYKSYLVYNDDLILALTRPYIADGLKISKCPQTYDGSLLNQRVAVIRCNDNINQDYVYQFLRSDYVLTIYKSMFVGKGQQPNLKKEDVTELLIPLPPLKEQNRIVQKVEELIQNCNDLEESIKQSESQNEKLLQQVLREALRKEEIIEIGN